MKHETISIQTPFIKLDALLKFAAVAQTGGHAKDIILQGEVLVDDAPCLQRGRKIYPGMTVTVQDHVFEVCSGAH